MVGKTSPTSDDHNFWPLHKQNIEDSGTFKVDKNISHFHNAQSLLSIKKLPKYVLFAPNAVIRKHLFAID